MWPFKKDIKTTNSFTYTQVDITENFGDNQRLSSEEWIQTIPINSSIHNPEFSGLPPVNSSPERVYEIATKLSELRGQINNSTDGVYCPVCHIANVDLSKLNSPCHKCNRYLLRFGWN